MSAITYQSFNSLLCEFVSELSQTFDEYPELAKSNETLTSLMALADTISLPMKTFHKTFEKHSSMIMNKDPTLFEKCSIPYTDSFDLNKEYNESDADTQNAIRNYLQQLFVTATTVRNMPASMMTNIESVAQACMQKVQSGEVTEEQAQNPLFIMQQLQQNPDLMKAMQPDDGQG
ncbi:unnamed protein product [Sphacelaria rigidula]